MASSSLNFLLLFSVCGVLTTTVSAIPVEDFYPYGLSAGDNLLNRTLDGSSPNIITPSQLKIFGRYFSEIFVNNNGNISPGGPFGQFIPQVFPTSFFPLIAVYWADADTQPEDGGFVWYQIITSSDLLQRALDDIRLAYPSAPDIEYLLIATWDHIGYYNLHTDKTNTFQCVLAVSGDETYVIYLYADGLIQWTTGDDGGGVGGLGGNPALVGYNAGDGIISFTVPGSQTDDIIRIASTSNVDVPGVWVFRVSDDIPSCDQTLSIYPRYGNMLGGTAIRICVLNVTSEDTIECNFEGRSLPGVYLNNTEILCVSPRFSQSGPVALQFTITRDGESVFNGEATFHVLSFDQAHGVDVISPDGLLIDLLQQNTISWDKDSLTPFNISSSVTVDINIVLLTPDGTWIDYINLASNIENTGYFTSLTTFEIDERCPSNDTCPISISVQINTIPEMPEIADYDLKISVWSGTYYYTLLNNFMLLCEDWNKKQELGIDIRTLATCPPTKVQADAINSGFMKQDTSSIVAETSYHSQWMDYFHPEAESCYIQSSFGFGISSRQQCCYNTTGGIILKSLVGGGTPDLYAPVDARSIINHIFEDLVPYIYCCRGTMPNCLMYTKYRPILTDREYVPLLPACVYGDPHIVTLDGLKYTFNGKGEYILIATEGDVFTLQGRMVEADGVNGTTAQATVFSALVAKHNNSDTIQFELSQNGIDTRVNGEIIDFSESSVQPFNQVILTDKGNNTFSALFSIGALVEVVRENDIISTVLVSVPSTLQGLTVGLMGIFNNDTSDDLSPRSGQPIPSNSSIQDIHEQFGVSWIISSEEESLFTYEEGEGFQTFYDPFYLPMFEIQFDDPNLEETALEICGDDQFCLYDIAATQNISIGLTTLIGSETFDLIVNLSAPFVCEPPCENGVCVGDNSCSCMDGYTGPTCSELDINSCDVNPCLNGGSCSLISQNYVCDCVTGYRGSFCQNQPPLSDCMCSRDIECSISGTYVGNDLMKVKPNGNIMKCLVAFDTDSIELDSIHVDQSFNGGQQFFSAGSLAFLENVGIVETRSEYTMCMIQDDFIDSLPSGSPTATLEEFGVESLHIQYMECDGSFHSLQLSRNEVEQIVFDDDYGVNGLLCDDNACSLQHLLYWLATLNDNTSASGDIGSGGSAIHSGSGDGDDLLFPDSSGMSTTDTLPVRVTNTLCKANSVAADAEIVFPVTC